MAWKGLNVVGDSSCSGVFHLILNRPSHRNALDANFFTEFPQALASLDANPSARVIILMGSGKHFCSGIDLSYLSSYLRGSQIPDVGENHKHKEDDDDDPGRVREKFRRDIKHMQAAITALEECRKPVIAAIHGGCIGAGVDLMSACDIRYCTEDAFFSVKEINLAVTADLGSLQRLPRLVGMGYAMELALTGRGFDGFEAKQMGLIQTVFPTKAAMEEHVISIAKDIAGKSPLAVSGAKAIVLKSRDLPVEQALDYVATWNAAMLLSTDLKEALSAQIQKRKPLFAKL